MKETYIIDAVRTPRARRKGKFSTVHPVDLLTYPLNAIVNRNNLEPKEIEDVAIGCVTQTTEQAWCVARNAILAAGWPITVPGVTINRLCASGLQACNFISNSIKSGNYSLAIAGGLEHMTRVPMFSDTGGEESSLLKKFHPNLVDQGRACELLVDHFKISRDDINRFALRSQIKAKEAKLNKKFSKSLIPIPYHDENNQEQILDFDDNPRPETTIEALNSLKTVFKEDGTITAGNASAIVDGAATVLFANENKIQELNLKPRARVVASAVIGSDPLIMLSGPIEASKLALKKANLRLEDIDIWEINEAFAPVVLATVNTLGIDMNKVNVNGGAIALGHPLGATGAILLGTALDELEFQQKRYALITLCIGLGMGVATIIERI